MLRRREDRCYLYREKIGLDIFWGPFQFKNEIILLLVR